MRKFRTKLSECGAEGKNPAKNPLNLANLFRLVISEMSISLLMSSAFFVAAAVVANIWQVA